MADDEVPEVVSDSVLPACGARHLVLLLKALRVEGQELFGASVAEVVVADEVDGLDDRLPAGGAAHIREVHNDYLVYNIPTKGCVIKEQSKPVTLQRVGEQRITELRRREYLRSGVKILQDVLDPLPNFVVELVDGPDLL